MKKPLVRVEFDDHSECTGENPDLIECVVFGVLTKETKKAYYVCSWIASGELEGPNNITYCILKSAVTKFSVIRKDHSI